MWNVFETCYKEQIRTRVPQICRLLARPSIFSRQTINNMVEVTRWVHTKHRWIASNHIICEIKRARERESHRDNSDYGNFKTKMQPRTQLYIDSIWQNIEFVLVFFFFVFVYSMRNHPFDWWTSRTDWCGDWSYFIFRFHFWRTGHSSLQCARRNGICDASNQWNWSHAIINKYESISCASSLSSSFIHFSVCNYVCQRNTILEPIPESTQKTNNVDETSHKRIESKRNI